MCWMITISVFLILFAAKQKIVMPSASSHPEYNDLFSQVTHFYNEIASVALENEKQKHPELKYSNVHLRCYQDTTVPPHPALH